TRLSTHYSARVFLQEGRTVLPRRSRPEIGTTEPTLTPDRCWRLLTDPGLTPRSTPRPNRSLSSPSLV
ncbi:hypothetical protein BHM03_00044567, partial [Ensete ventricosum]